MIFVVRNVVVKYADWKLQRKLIPNSQNKTAHLNNSQNENIKIDEKYDMYNVIFDLFYFKEGVIHKNPQMAYFTDKPINNYPTISTASYQIHKYKRKKGS